PCWEGSIMIRRIDTHDRHSELLGLRNKLLSSQAGLLGCLFFGIQVALELLQGFLVKHFLTSLHPHLYSAWVGGVYPAEFLSLVPGISYPLTKNILMRGIRRERTQTTHPFPQTTLL